MTVRVFALTGLFAGTVVAEVAMVAVLVTSSVTTLVRVAAESTGVCRAPSTLVLCPRVLFTESIVAKATVLVGSSAIVEAAGAAATECVGVGRAGELALTSRARCTGAVAVVAALPCVCIAEIAAGAERVGGGCAAGELVLAPRRLGGGHSSAAEAAASSVGVGV